MLHERPSAGGTVKIEPNAPDIRGLRERDVSGSASERRDLQSFGSGLLVRGEGGAGGGEDGGWEGGEEVVCVWGGGGGSECGMSGGPRLGGYVIIKQSLGSLHKACDSQTDRQPALMH